MFELAKVPTRKIAFKLSQFCYLKNQQRFILEEEVPVSLKKLAAILNTLRQFLKKYDKAVKFPALHPLPKPKQEIGFTLFKDELFGDYFQDIKRQCNRQIRLCFCFERNTECCFFINKFQTDGERNVPTEILNLRHCEVQSLYKYCCYIPSKRGIFDSIYDIRLKNSCSGTLPKSKYSATHRRCDLSKIRYVEAKSAYTKRTLKKSARTPTNVSNEGRAVTCTIFFLGIRNHELPYLVEPTALEKRQSPITKTRNSRL